MAEIVGWFSLKGGAHIPIMKGQTKAEAAKKYYASKHGKDVAKLSSKNTYEVKKNNKGTKLTKEQQEYFKDSKVRDEKGNLLEVYHGTTKNFDEFKYRTEDERGVGPGFYFTSNYDSASSYSSNTNNTKSVYLNIKNPIDAQSFTETKITKAQFDKFNKYFNIEVNRDFNDWKKQRKNLPAGPISNREVLTTCFNRAKEKGYDSTVILKKFTEITGYDGIKNNNIWVAFFSNQIKASNNKKPTNSNNINK